MTHRWVTTVGWLVALGYFLGFYLVAFAAVPFGFTVDRAVCLNQPCIFVLTITAEHDPDNRCIDITTEGDREGSDYHHSEIQLDGERAPRVIQTPITLRGAGDYEIRMTLVRAAPKDPLYFKRFVKVGVVNENTKHRNRRPLN